MTTKAQEEKPKTVKVKFTQNVKYRGAYYSAGEKLDIPAEEKAALIKDDVIAGSATIEDDDGDQ
ncbi:hypothetical protein P5G65_04850 [Paenibacillus chondroitinus]|uniref:DUF7210 domain-containing protein n=1 Tax=Paenibacillus chondroitinus TaxID=59842 RepID=A0ABU6D659_9BACL|nr:MULTISPECIES: hypothetical protein [Paenibacillus]MCY9658124.1 hypothetical protein [Paenibacillus anseongense]MEB4793214.1 hypothetical protein [Paenibacillus chondroitinus]